MTLNYDTIAQKYGLSTAVVHHLAQAVANGNGKLAQFNHPQLGGMGQWMPGMIMIGDAFNHSLKAKILAVCHELAIAYDSGELTDSVEINPMAQGKWWASDWKNPDISGGQNKYSYAYFADENRLVIMRDHEQTIYDTTSYAITGISQQQSNGHTLLIFHLRDGHTVTVTSFKRMVT